MTAAEQYEQYMVLHRDFSDTYTKVYKHVMDFYPLPQKFIQVAAPEIDSYVEKFAVHQNEPDESDSFQHLFYFAKNFKDFAADANGVFEEYKGLHGESDNYIKAIFKLKEKNHTGAEVVEYVQLIPVLNKLIDGFKVVKQKTDEAAKNLQLLQTEWGSIKQKIEPVNGTVGPL